MPITIQPNRLIKPAHEFDSKPGVAKVAFTQAGPAAVSATGSHESGAALFEPTNGANNAGFIGMVMIPSSIGIGIAALKNTIIAGFQGVVPGKAVYLGQDGQLTQDIVDATIAAPTGAPTLAQSAGAGALAAGVYKVAYSYVDTATGQTVVSPQGTVTLAASKQIDVTAVTPLPSGVESVNWFMSTAAGSTTLKFIANNNGAAFSINALPAGDAASPVTSVASVGGVAGSRRVGIGFTPYLIAFD